jgi:hypothetical protein
MSAASAGPELTVIVPFHDNAGQLELCLAALRASTTKFELVLVDDASRDPRAIEIAKAAATRYVRIETNSGPAVARNAGAKLASGEVLAFVDSDCVVHADALERMREALASNPEAAALFGSYDDSPAYPTTVSVYRNLLHHWVHHRGPREASTFWAGCGAIRKRVFESVGGFDERYRRPSIEDIELGMRIKASGGRILLLPEIQCKHLKHWRLVDMVVVDVTRRAIPWTKLLIERPGTGGDLNLELAQKLCVVCVFLALLAGPVAWLVPALRDGWLHVAVPFALLVPVVMVNQELYRLFLRRRGPLFALAGFALHLLYFFYGGLAFAWVKLTYRPAARAS